VPAGGFAGIWPGGAFGLGAGAAPFALASTFCVKRLIDDASTATLAAAAPRMSDASAESLSIATPNAPPKPTPVPTAAASTCILRVTLELAATLRSPARFRPCVDVPRYALAYTPPTESASTGTIALPPAAPAPASTCSVPVYFALTSADCSAAAPKFTPSSISAVTSMPTSATAMPAPMPFESDVELFAGASGIVMPPTEKLLRARLPDASPTVT